MVAKRSHEDSAPSSGQKEVPLWGPWALAKKRCLQQADKNRETRDTPSKQQQTEPNTVLSPSTPTSKRNTPVNSISTTTPNSDKHAKQQHCSTDVQTPTTELKSHPSVTPIQTPKTPRRAVATPGRSAVTPSQPSVSTPSSSRTPLSSLKAQPRTPVAATRDTGEQQHLHLSYKFLQPDERRDIHKRGPDHPDYDEKTLYVPEGFLNAQTPALRQWWLIKQRNMDTILFFKMGKFYELFNEDAVIGVSNLDIAYMKGDETRPAHAGFPEVAYEKYSKILIERGFKVSRIEQTETPAMMEERCASTGRKGKFDKVVKREICRITTKGTQMLGIMETVFHSVQNQYLLALSESEGDYIGDEIKRPKVFGVAFTDVTIGRVYIGQFADDHNYSNLNLLLAHYKPTEVLYPRNEISPETHQSLLRTGAILTPLRADKEFWPIKKALAHAKTHNLFWGESGNFQWPELLGQLFEGDKSESLLSLEPKQEYEKALDSFGALIYYLQSQLIADQVLRCASFQLYRTPLRNHKATRPVPNNVDDIEMMAKPPMILDHIALKNLEVFENCDGGADYSLFQSINNCKTHFGQRLLKNWLCSPLCDIKQINNRLDAVEALVSNRNASLLNEIVHTLSQTPDLERLLSKIKSQCFKSESDSRAIMFDNDHYSKARISSFLNLLNNFKRLRKFIISIGKSARDSNSQILQRLLSFTTNGGLYPDYEETLKYFDSAFDHIQAQKTGKIIPSHGVDQDFDRCQATIDGVKEELERYLEDQKQILKCRHIEYFGTAKNRYQIQVPDSFCKNVPSDYRIETTRKGVKRYYTAKIDRLFQKLMLHEEELKKCLDNIMSKIFAQFSNKMKLWLAATECLAILDVLQSVASFVRSLKASNVEVCRPKFLSEANPIVDYTEGRHPALVKNNSSFISNDLTLDHKLILLTGANMGGKSTLMRQTALLVILGQIGSFVPAAKLELTPVDRIFSRLGASDRLLEGESTFYTELIETSAMLSCATKDSLLLLDELGRGTSTHDGTAIAYSVIKEISENLRSRCLFSTHYHSLVEDFKSSGNIRLAHMACKVDKESDATIDSDPLKEQITFLYKIAEGPVSRSYGFNVAKLAGINDEIIGEAFQKAKELQLKCKIIENLHKITLVTPHLNPSILMKQVLQVV